MIRTILTANNNTLTLTLPNNYIGKQVEVIAFTVDEPFLKEKINKTKSFTTVKVNVDNYKFDRDELHER